jgi:hypothetical protein
LFQLIVLLPQLLDFITGGISQSISGQAVLACFQKCLGPFVVDTGGDTFSSAYLGYGSFTSETFKNDSDLLICGEFTAGGLLDLCDYVFRFCHCS